MFPTLARRIAALYTFLGLCSIPILTIVTTISVANMFVHGQLAQSSTIELWWAVIFAAAIEVNIFRLFCEAKMYDDTLSLRLAIGLLFVAGVALAIEGVQQSIGFDWQNIWIRVLVVGVICVRVGAVMLLLAREGFQRGMLSRGQEDVPNVHESINDVIDHFTQQLSTVVHHTEMQHLQQSVQESLQEMRTQLDSVHSEKASSVQQEKTPVHLHTVKQKQTVHSLKSVQPHKQKAFTLLAQNPDISAGNLAKELTVSRTTANNYKREYSQKKSG